MQDAHYDRGGDGGRNGGLATTRLAEERQERLAMNVLHHQKDLIFADDHVENGHDVRVANPRRIAGLVQEHLLELIVPEQMRMETLRGDHARETSRALQPRQMNRGHATGRDLAVDRIPTQPLPGWLFSCGVHAWPGRAFHVQPSRYCRLPRVSLSVESSVASE